MLFYILFLCFILFLCGRYNIIPGHYLISRKIGFDISIFFIVVIASLRFNIGYDWSSYFAFVYPNYSYQNILRIEPLSRLYIFFAGYFHTPLIMYVLFAITTYALIGKTIKKYSLAQYESLIIYIALFFLDSLSIMRQATAISLLFYGYKYIYKKSIFKYFLICLIATLYHRTAIIGIVFYFIFYMKPTWCFFLVVLFLLFMKFILPILIGQFFPVFLFYLGKGGIKDSSGNFTRLFYFLLYIYCLVFLPPKNKIASGVLNICSWGVMLPFVLGGHTGGRIASYFLIYYLLLIPNVNSRFNIRYRIVFLFLFYIYFFMFLLVTVVANQSNEYVPFRWYFLESLDQKLM